MEISPPKTAFDLKEIILRCLRECKDAGYIAEHLEVSADPALEKKLTVIINQDQVADHISKTIIGELLEFEVIRKMAPWFRSFHSVESDLITLTERERAHNQLIGLRIGEK